MSYQEKQKEFIDDIVSRIETSGEMGSTIVEIQRDYANDRAMCLTSVAYPDKEFQGRIQEELIRPMRAIDPDHYYYPSDSFHVTIKTVRVIQDPPSFNEETIQKAHQVFQKIVPNFSSFDFDFRRMVRFPTSVALIGYTDRIFGDLVSILDRGLKDAGIPDDKQYVSDSVFFGNMTFCRFTSKPSPELIQWISDHQDIVLGLMNVREVSLITGNAVAHLSKRRTMSLYTFSS